MCVRVCACVSLRAYVCACVRGCVRVCVSTMRCKIWAVSSPEAVHFFVKVTTLGVLCCFTLFFV